jgi:hypothetical protein
MTYAAPTGDYDDGLVHSHDWSRNTPPGGHPHEAGRAMSRKAHDHDDGLVHEHRWARG